MPKVTYEPNTICEICFMSKKEARGNKCWMQDRHLWNKKQLTLQVQYIQETPRSERPGILPRRIQD